MAVIACSLDRCVWIVMSLAQSRLLTMVQVIPYKRGLMLMLLALQDHQQGRHWL